MLSEVAGSQPRRVYSLSVPCLALYLTRFLNLISSCSCFRYWQSLSWGGDNAFYRQLSVLCLLRHLMPWSWRFPCTRVWAHSKVAWKGTYVLRGPTGFSLLHLSLNNTFLFGWSGSFPGFSFKSVGVWRKPLDQTVKLILLFFSSLWWTSTIIPTISASLGHEG